MKPWVLPVVCGVAGVALGVTVAKYTLPPKVTERVVTEVKTVEVVKWQDRVVEVQGPTRTVVHYKKVPGPQGPTVEVEKVVEREKIVTVHDNAGTTQVATQEKVEASKVTDARPWLALEGMAATDFQGAWAFQGAAHIRVLGPIWVGPGAVKADRWYVGPSARLEF